MCFVDVFMFLMKKICLIELSFIVIFGIWYYLFLRFLEFCGVCSGTGGLFWRVNKGCVYLMEFVFNYCLFREFLYFGVVEFRV